jgi:glyoxylase-like metal-dependent hydrolase (beta-lactamase superfamily II)
MERLRDQEQNRRPADPAATAGATVDLTAGVSRTAWADAGAFAVAPGVHRIPLPLPHDSLRAVNVYAIEDVDGLTLIDAGWAMAQSLRALEAGLAVAGHDLGEIKRVLVTHIHRDHYTQAVELRRRVGARVSLGIGERPGLAALHEVGTNLPATTLAALDRAGATDLAARIRAAIGPTRWDLDDWEFPDEWLTAGSIDLGTRALRVIPTPGHTIGHVVFLDETAGLLFSGDHVLPHITPSIGFELGRSASGLPLGDFLDSLRLVTAYPDATLLPAHGPVAPSVHGRVAELLDHHDQRLAEIVAAIGERRLSGYEVAGRLMWTRRHTALPDLDAGNQMLAVAETMAHLDLLVARHRLSRADDAGIALYRQLQPAQ